MRGWNLKWYVYLTESIWSQSLWDCKAIQTFVQRVNSCKILVFVKESVQHGPWEISHEREARVSSAEGARARRRRKTSEGGERRAKRVFRRRRKRLRSKTDSLNIHSFLCANLECQFKEIITKKWIKHGFFFCWSQRKPIDNNGRSILSLGW